MRCLILKLLIELHLSKSYSIITPINTVNTSRVNTIVKFEIRVRSRAHSVTR